MDITQIIGGIAAVILLLFLFSGSKKSEPRYAQGEIRIGRDVGGTFYVYEVNTGQIIAQEMTKDEAAQFVYENTRR